MRNECNIIRDLLPLYVEKMVSPDTAAFVEEHLKDCEACRKEYERIEEPQPTEEISELPFRPKLRTRCAAAGEHDSGGSLGFAKRICMPKLQVTGHGVNSNISDAAPLLKLRRKMKLKRIQTIALTAVFVTVLFVSAFAVLDAPIYLPYSEEIVTVGQLGDKGMLLTFDEEVTDFDYMVYDDPDGGNFYCCDIQAWTSLWDKWFSRRKGTLSATVTTQDTKPVIASYVPNDGSENVCIAKYDPNAENRIEKNVEYESTIVLPRLSLGYYLILAAAVLAVLGIVWILTRRKAEVRVWIERIGLYPAAYIISHCIVSGIGWASYLLPRDFALIIFISVLLYSGLLLAHNIWRLKREIKEINQ